MDFVNDENCYQSILNTISKPYEIGIHRKTKGEILGSE
jgi:hypothetical protein